jgi:2-(1,2-epoxy-1,2-dihydrophenyl)acetyl-CoA isomerase
MIDQGLVLLDVHDGVARLTLNRPDAANGMNAEVLRALCDAIVACHGQPGVRAVLLMGKGKNFCAGGDVHTFASKGEGMPDYLRVATALLQNAVAGLLRLNAPVVAAVQGFAAGGGGFGLVCASDLVIAGESARFLAGATRVGMAPDAGVSVILPRLVGLRRAAEIILTNPVLTAREALDLGIINRVVPDRELESSAVAWVNEIASGAPKALAAARRMLWAGLGWEWRAACLRKRAWCPSCVRYRRRPRGSGSRD